MGEVVGGREEGGCKMAAPADQARAELASGR